MSRGAIIKEPFSPAKLFRGALADPPEFLIYLCSDSLYFCRCNGLWPRQGFPVISENQPPQRSFFKNPLVYSSLLILIVAAYLGWILLSRHQATRAYEERAEQAQAKKQRESDQAAIEQLGGNDLAIQMLYATTRIRGGETAQICYGVANAKTVTLEPQSSKVWPSHNLCVDVKPAKTTTYTLVATGADGKNVSQQVTVEVR
jgi:hypothetical protein